LAEPDPERDHLAALLFAIELRRGEIVSSATYPYIDLATAKRVAGLDSDFELIWWTDRNPPYLAWRIILGRNA
jgi:hypothetical protein